jgi:hypothetical protein
VLAAVKQNGMALQTLGRLGGSFERDWWRGGGLCQICHKQVTHIVCPQRYAYNLEREREGDNIYICVLWCFLSQTYHFFGRNDRHVRSCTYIKSYRSVH